MTNHSKKLSELRDTMKVKGIGCFIIPSNDEFMNEYVPGYARRLEFLTGFTGSAGMAVVTQEKAAFFTDGRYTLQATQQLPEGEYEIFNTSDVKPINWIKQNLPESQTLGINPMLFSKDSISRYQSVLPVNLCEDLIDKIWHDKPQKPVSEIKLHSLAHTGKTHIDKINDITKIINERGADALLITAPDSICWLLNIRGNDVPNTPLVLARLFLESDCSGVLFVDAGSFPLPEGEESYHSIKIKPLNELNKFLQDISGKKILLDKNNAPYSFYNELKEKNNIIEIPDPCTLPKACKNNVEVNGAYDAHVRDAIAVTSFLYWLEENYKKYNVTEVFIDEKLLEFRQKDPTFVEPSFDTIAGFASNGAIVHYRASGASSKKIEGNNLLLLDSGGQYLSGTTDITRTVAIGTPSREQKHNFTLVLKGHIAIATAIFPEGTSGHQIDILARQYLWQYGLDYDHGTGHGVGSFLGVHEGPQRISKAPNEVALMPGMIISNEPGYYKNGEYGIRIENLVVVEPAIIDNNDNKRKFFQFSTLTCVPFDPQLIDFTILDKKEKTWLLDYHKSINNKISTKLDIKAKAWLKTILLIYEVEASNMPAEA